MIRSSRAPFPLTGTSTDPVHNVNSVSVPVSWGEVLDKLTILRIKSKKITNLEKKANVDTELAALEEIVEDYGVMSDELRQMVADLAHVNSVLWDIEDRIRVCERDAQFDSVFVALARSVYKTNDERAAIKRRINVFLQSGFVEEKSYQDY